MRGREEVNDGVDAAVQVHEADGELQAQFEDPLLGAGGLAEHLRHHELDDVEVVGDEAHDHGHQHHQREQAGSAVVAPLARQRVVPGRPAQLDGDLHVAEEDDGHRPAEAQSGGHQDHDGQREHPLDAVVLHACQPASHAHGHGEPEQGRCLQRRQDPHGRTDELGPPGLTQPDTLVGADHGQVAVHAHARHQVDAWVGVHKEDEGRQPAEPLPERPVEVQQEVGDLSRQGQSEQEVGHWQVDQEDTCRVDLLVLLIGQVKGQDVSQDGKDQEGRVEQRQHHTGHPGRVVGKAGVGVVDEAAWVSRAWSHVIQVLGKTRKLNVVLYLRAAPLNVAVVIPLSRGWLLWPHRL